MRRFYLLLFVLGCLAACGKDDVKPNGGGGSGDVAGDITVRGIIYDNAGSTMSGVVVSDGLKCVKTGSDGRFEIDSDISKTKFVSVVVPSGYKVPVENGQAQFYKRLGEGDAQQINGVYQLRFTLEKIAGDAERYTIIVAGDPQPRARTAGYDKIAYHSLDCCDDMWRDIKEFSATVTGRPCYGFMLGDLVHENMNLYADYKAGLAQMNFPIFSVIGNHDNDTTAADDDAGAAYFEMHLGPRNYALDLGRFHVVVLDNLIMYPNSAGQLKSYYQGLTDDIWMWLQNDLKYVERSTPIIVCSHSPMFMLAGGSDRSQSSATRHGADYANLLSKYEKVYAWAGHVHNAFNYVYSASSNFPNIEQHSVARATGALWTNEWLNEDGTPRGYVVAEVDGKDISWTFRPIKYQSGAAAASTPEYKYRDWTLKDGVAQIGGKPVDTKYQLRAYPRGTYGDKYVYVNVFMWDEAWGSVTFTSPKTGTTAMTRVTDAAKRFDAAYKEVFDYYKANSSTLKNDSGYAMSYDLPHLFRCYSSAESDSGTVTVTDRFGNEYSTTVSW